MAGVARPRTRRLTVIAQDPSVRDPTAPARRQIVRARVEVPCEVLDDGPRGFRLHVVDYDLTRERLYRRFVPDPEKDPFEKSTDRQLLRDPHFHCQNVYALVMRTLARFEFALGRRVGWGFGKHQGHQLNLVPHAFAEANAFYSPYDQALLFGYFPSSEDDGIVYTCLSHDVVVHEAAHALLDGLRERYTDPSSKDQAAFHEGFADVVALLSVFSLPGVAGRVLDLAGDERDREKDWVRKQDCRIENLRESGLLGLAEEMGSELTAVRGNPLRRSAGELSPPSPLFYQKNPEFEEPHRRGEILVAAIMNAFLEAWVDRIGSLGEVGPGRLSRKRVAEEGAEIAGTLLTLAIRAIDYTPPIHIEFGDHLSAMLTSDAEVRPDDSKYELRSRLLESFRAYGIEPAAAAGTWDPAPPGLTYDRTHFEPMRSNPDEVFRFVWENRDPELLAICDEAFSRIISVRPVVRVGPDGFVLHEVVAEHLQTLVLDAGELHRYGITRPDGMPTDTEIHLHGGGALIFDEYGRLKYHVHNSVLHPERQSKRLAYMWKHGAFRKDAWGARQFSNVHLSRAVGRAGGTLEEEW